MCGGQWVWLFLKKSSSLFCLSATHYPLSTFSLPILLATLDSLFSLLLLFVIVLRQQSILLTCSHLTTIYNRAIPDPRFRPLKSRVKAPSFRLLFFY